MKASRGNRQFRRFGAQHPRRPASRGQWVLRASCASGLVAFGAGAATPAMAHSTITYCNWCTIGNGQWYISDPSSTNNLSGGHAEVQNAFDIVTVQSVDSVTNPYASANVAVTITEAVTTTKGQFSRCGRYTGYNIDYTQELCQYFSGK